MSATYRAEIRIVYEANGVSGYTCRATGASGLMVNVRRSQGAVDLEAQPESLPTAALVGAVERYAEQEYMRRRTRNEQKRQHHEKEAKLWRATAERLGELLGCLTESAESGWCSACMALSNHRLARSKTRWKTRRYVCVECGSATGWCDVPRCRNFADRGGRPGSEARWCAEHRHDIPSFEKLDASVDSLDDYLPWLEYERIDARKFTTVAVASVAGLAIVGPLAFVAAPAIGGTIGAATGLSGAAATSHGLAVLGGGALAAGGYGMAGGTAVVTAVGAGLGGASGASVANAYVRTDRSLGFEKLRDGGAGTVILANGFLSEGMTGWGEWERMIQRRYPDATVYRLTWGAKELKSLMALISQPAGQVTQQTARRLAAQATKQSGRMLGPLNIAFSAASLAKNPWHVARTRADMTGAVLADALVRSNLQSVVLIGFSLGARVMVAAAEALATTGRAEARVEAMHLLGAAVSTRRDWHAIDSAVEGAIWNYWSKNDNILRYVYRAGEGGAKAVGSEGVPSAPRTIKNVDVSKRVQAHQHHLTAVMLR